LALSRKCFWLFSPQSAQRSAWVGRRRYQSRYSGIVLPQYPAVAHRNQKSHLPQVFLRPESDRIALDEGILRVRFQKPQPLLNRRRLEQVITVELDDVLCP